MSVRRRAPSLDLRSRLDHWAGRSFLDVEQQRQAAPPIPVQPSPGVRSRFSSTGGLVTGLLLPVATGVALVPLREVVPPSNGVLILVLPVVIVAFLAGFGPGALAAVTAALAFDLLLTRPYYSTTIHAAEDVEAATVLLVIALVVSQLAAHAADARARSTRRRTELLSFYGVAEALAHHSGADLVGSALRAVEDLLHVEARWAPGCHGHASPTLLRDGKVEGRPDAALLPVDTELPVMHGGTELGRLLLRARTERVVSREERQVAIAVADLFGRGLADRVGADKVGEIAEVEGGGTSPATSSPTGRPAGDLAGAAPPAPAPERLPWLWALLTCCLRGHALAGLRGAGLHVARDPEGAVVVRCSRCRSMVRMS